MECDICLIQWDSNEHIPRLLSCGHTFCQVCLKLILKKAKSNKRKFFCPTCNAIQSIIKDDDINRLIKNYNLLELTEKSEEDNWETKGSPKKKTSNPIIELLQIDDTNPKNSLSDSINNQKNTNFIFDIENRCALHNLPIHSYAVGTNMLFCDECIKETELLSEILPNVENDLHSRIDSCLFKACIAKNQILLLQNFFKSYLSEFEKINTQKIENLFDYFEQIILFFRNKVNQTLVQCIKRQKSNISSYLKEMSGLNKELTLIENELTKIGNIKDVNLLVKNIDNIKKNEKRLVNFINYDLEFNLLSMNISFNENEKDNLYKIIEKSINSEVEFFEIQKKLPTIRQILRVDETWPCICDEVNNPLEEIKCSSCGLFRRYETLSKIKNVSSNIQEGIIIDKNNRKNKDNNFSCNDDIKDILCGMNKNIVKSIKKEYSKNFKILVENINYNNINNNSLFYAIDLGWFRKWKKFIQQFEVYPPGPIDNRNLLQSNILTDKYELKPKLIRNKDYMIVNQQIWEFLYLNYNGGPIIEVSDDKHLKLEDNIINISDYCIQSYSSLKDEYMGDEEEQELNESIGYSTLDKLDTSVFKKSKKNIKNRFNYNRISEYEENLNDKDIFGHKEK